MPLDLPRLIRFNIWFWCCVALFEITNLLLEVLVWKEKFELKYLLLSFGSLAVQLALTSALLTLAQRWQLSALRLFLATALLALCYIPLFNYASMLLWQKYDFHLNLLLGQLDTHALAFFVWAAAFLSFSRYCLQQAQAQESHRLAQNIQQLELQALRHQLNPHFTFNALNSVCALLEAERFEDAELMSEQLSTFLRYSLSHSPDSLVRLADELSAIEAYLTLQKTRFGDKLRVQWHIDEQIKQQLVPALLLQPLVENAIKYAVAAQQNGATITISGGQCDGLVQLSVQDDGPGAQSAAGHGTGVGLRNIRDRLYQHFGEQARLVVQSLPAGFSVAIALPPQQSSVL
ncbi:sensor histidine kinase [Rheinheimera texasensis]|uniref:sensor histidine kinase n=1 Tax=Rheinheimera texasensis TaxID=306205 RepID=UPI0004E13B74|nr:histidine kinase [Rheinheimera texasensis]